MSDARTAILGRIDKALATARIPASARTDPDRATARQAIDALLERFVTESRALGVDVFVEASGDAVRERLRSLTDGLRVLSWDAARLPYNAGAVLGTALPPRSPRADQAAAEVGVTGCQGAIAETGSLALISAPGCSRAASLLPPLHVALVDPASLYFSMGDFFAARAADIASASNLTFVTGPSRTADIELSLTIGVHGPARVVVIVGP
jgi:L-lactate dehydrogenase complex protein LldG